MGGNTGIGTKKPGALLDVESSNSTQAAPEPLVVVHQLKRGFHIAAQRLSSGFAFAEARGIVRRVLQHTVAAAILTFYSKNAMSTAIRGNQRRLSRTQRGRSHIPRIVARSRAGVWCRPDLRPLVPKRRELEMEDIRTANTL